MIEVPLAHARVVFTTREGGASDGRYESMNIGRFTDDDRKTVNANIDTLQTTLGLEAFQLMHQVHSGSLTASDWGSTDEMPTADATTTTERLLGLLATGADCPPVALASASRVAILHCGWRPVAADIIETAVNAFDGEDFEAAIGPGICQKHFEVGQEVIDALQPESADAADGRQLDLRAVIATRLEKAGASKVQNVDRCTYCEPDQFFSHRRDKGATGRQAGVVWRI